MKTYNKQMLSLDRFLNDWYNVHIFCVHAVAKATVKSWFASFKPGPHVAMLYTCDGAFHLCCDARKSHAMCCDRKLNMLNILHSISEYLSYLRSDFQAVFSIMMDI